MKDNKDWKDKIFPVWNKTRNEYTIGLRMEDAPSRDQAPHFYAWAGFSIWVKMLGRELDNWYHAGPEFWERDGYNTDASKLMKSKPFPEAFLAYSPRNRQWSWFIRNGDCGKGRTAPYLLTGSYYKDSHLWRLGADGRWTHGRPNSFEYNHGYEFGDMLTEQKEEKKEMPTRTELQDKLIDYCAPKPARAHHLKALTRLGVMSRDYTYDEVAKVVRDYLNTTPGICTDGAQRAIDALGISEDKWVKVTVTSYEIYKNPGVFKWNMSDGRPSSNTISPAHLAPIPSEVVFEVWKKESK